MADRPNASATRPPEHPPIAEPRVGVLLVNLGTPDAANAGAVRRYLREFLSDRRVVDYPRAVWLPILYGIILNVRPAKTARAYSAIWRADSNESPLRYFTRRQADALSEGLGGDIAVDWAMRYGAPPIAGRLAALKEKGCERILIVPLYPQYSATTTATVNDAVFRALEKMRWQPAIRTMPPFHDTPAYIGALTAVARRRLEELDWAPERVLISFHGLPQRYFDAGDPYFCHCSKTARLLRAEMRWSEEFAPMTFQSKFGPEKWLEPATDVTLEKLAGEGVRRVAVMTPGFVSDCIETLEEIAIAGRSQFLAAGGEAFDAIPCINDAPETVALLDALVRRETAGWVA
ncbi:MAG: ferrochelatase [Parvularculaceae bacterium]